MSNLQYVRTDRNGTKIYHDWQCPRCGGAGQLEQWAMTGRICWKCGGTGRRVNPSIVKEYTPEYKAKLDARRAAREAARPKPSEEEIARSLEEARKRSLVRCGLNPDGSGFILTGDTYDIKEDIKRRGGRWLYGAWFCPEKVEADGVKVFEVNAYDYYSDNNFNLFQAREDAIDAESPSRGG